MELPAELQIDGTLEQGMVYFYPEDGFTNDRPHFFVVLNKDPKSDEIIFLTCASSQVDKHQRWIEDMRLPASTLVIVEKGECSFLPKRTVFDCNAAQRKTRLELIEKAQKGELKIKGQLPGKILQKILSGVMRSSMVVENVKKAIC